MLNSQKVVFKICMKNKSIFCNIVASKHLSGTSETDMLNSNNENVALATRINQFWSANLLKVRLP